MSSQCYLQIWLKMLLIWQVFFLAMRGGCGTLTCFLGQGPTRLGCYLLCWWFTGGFFIGTTCSWFFCFLYIIQQEIIHYFGSINAMVLHTNHMVEKLYGFGMIVILLLTRKILIFIFPKQFISSPLFTLRYTNGQISFLN